MQSPAAACTRHLNMLFWELAQQMQGLEVLTSGSLLYDQV